MTQEWKNGPDPEPVTIEQRLASLEDWLAGWEKRRARWRAFIAKHHRRTFRMVGALLTFISMAVFVAWSTTWRIHSRDVGGFVPPLVNAILAFLFAAILVVGILNVLWSYSSPTEASSCVCRACRPFPRKDKDLR